MDKVVTEILIVGGGPAGIAAASAAASNDVSVTIVDDNPRLGGQIWRAELGKTKTEAAANLIDSIDKGTAKIVNNAQVFAARDDNCLFAETEEGRVELEFEKLILATGARELFLPFPGWTLPNVLGAGGLQALAKGGLDVKRTRVVVAGTGPLLFAVADYLKSKGAVIAAIVEQATSAQINRFARGLRRSPSKLLQAAVLRARLLGVPYLKDAWITAAQGDGRLQSISVRVSKKKRTIECDHLAAGFHLVPNTELAELLGCELERGLVMVDEFQRTSKENVFCAGEPTGIGGVEKALIEGEIAGLKAANYDDKATALLARARRARNFAESLNRTFALRDELKMLAHDSTIVCRCEDVQYGKLKDFDNWRSAKLQTRCGMGPCQGRICGAAAKFLFGWEPNPVRTPIFPVKLENL